MPGKQIDCPRDPSSSCVVTLRIESHQHLPVYFSIVLEMFHEFIADWIKVTIKLTLSCRLDGSDSHRPSTCINLGEKIKHDRGKKTLFPTKQKQVAKKLLDLFT